MEKQNLPNSTLILILGILSLITCCCYGLPGVIFGVIALVLAKTAKEVYIANPELYSGYNNVRTGRILSIIGIVLSVIYILLIVLALIFYGGVEGIMELQEEMMREYGA